MSSKDSSKSSVMVGETEICSPCAIIKEYEKEFSNRLAHKAISEEFVDYDIKKQIQQNKKQSKFNVDNSEKARGSEDELLLLDVIIMVLI